MGFKERENKENERRISFTIYRKWKNQIFKKAKTKKRKRDNKMGSFSWQYASEKSETLNFCPGDEIKVLIPEHFGIGEIVGSYEDYGIVLTEDGKEYDLYDLIAIFNAEDLKEKEINDKIKQLYKEKKLPTVEEVVPLFGDDDTLRIVGINIGCYDEQLDSLKYPLKVVPISEDVKYEDCNFISYGDPNQGFEYDYR